MAIDHIAIDTAQRLGLALRNELDRLALARRNITHLKAVMDHMTDGSDYAAIATKFGAGVGEGQALYNLVAGAVDDLATADMNSLLERVG